jgi:hypothetical protein
MMITRHTHFSLGRVSTLGLLLAMVWLTRGLAPAQPDNPGAADNAVPAEGNAGTNDVTQMEDSANGEEQVSTSTNMTPGLGTNAPGPNRISGREARERRFRRQRTNPASDSVFSSSASGTNGGPASLDYSAFKVVADRNIFNPNRYARSGPGPRVAPREYLTLVGTMSYEKGSFAFFSGTDSKALKLADSIAGFKVTNITPSTVKLASGTNELELRVGMQLTRDEDGPWVASSAPVTSSATQAASSSSTSATEPIASGPESDIIKKLMERRAKE